MVTNSNFFIEAVKISAVAGAALAIAALIPAFMPVITLFILPFLAAPAIIAYFKVIKKLPSFEIRNYATLGSIIGTVAGTTFLIIFCPLVLIIHLIFPKYYAYGINFLNIFLALILFVSIICIFGFMNVAMGLLTGFLINYFNKK